jgi:hypothetical protein
VGALQQIIWGLFLVRYMELWKTLLRRLLAVESIILLCVGCGVLSVVGLAFLADEAPYRIELTPRDGLSIVRFYQPSRRLVSPEFLVDLRLERSVVVVLDSGNVSIPGGSIEFYDFAPSPGRVKLRLGNKLFDVMEVQIFVDGERYDWQVGAAKRN